MSKRAPTMADVARLAGVSQGAASYALNGRPGVSDETRARVIAVAREIGWRPNNAARALKGAPAQTVGMGLCRPARVLGSEPFFMELISGIEAELSRRSLALLLQVVPDHENEIEAYTRWAVERRVDGVILVDLYVDDARVPVLERLGLPAVVAGGPGGGGALPYVTTDNAGPVEQSLRYLAELGHRRVARVSGLPDLAHTAVRDDAYAVTCRRLGLDTAAVVHTDFSGEQSAQVTRSLLEAPHPPTAILYDNDIMAVAGLGVAQEMQVPVPEQLSIIAWDDSPLCRLVRPSLTALQRDIAAFGAKAARHLLRVLDGESVDSVTDEPARLTPRASTGPAPDRQA